MRIFTKRKVAFYLNILIVIMAFLISAWPKAATVRVYLPKYWNPFLGFTGIWLSFAILGGKYNYDLKQNFSSNWMKILRVDAYAFGFMIALLYFFNVFYYSRLIVFGTVLGSFILESIFLVIWYYSRKFLVDKDVSTYIGAPPKEYEEATNVPVKRIVKLPQNDAESVLQDLKKVYLKDNLDLLGFIKDNSQLDRIPASKALVIFTHHFYNIKHFIRGSQLLFVNLHEVNGWSKVNQYLHKVNQNLQVGGYFVSCGEDYRHRHRRYFKHYPIVIAIIATMFDFIFRRVLRRIPGLREINYAMFHDTHKSFSQCEILGRVAYSGFDIIDVFEIDNLFYFIAQKITDVPEREDPIYGALIRMKRVGKNGKPISLYKLRTMYSYAEYLQEFLYHRNKLKQGGKFKDDFRIMELGKFLRRTWIDELPQFYNLLKGDVKLVGVRAISPHYFSLYPEEAKKIRTEVKPGMVPPFYVDMPKTFSEIVESEVKYINQYSKSPVFTDIKYFFLAVYNIIFRHARSG